MRRLLIAILVLCLLAPCCLASEITTMQSSASLGTDGRVQVSLTATIVLTEQHSTLLFPLGKNVSGVTLNGASARTTTTDGVVSVRLSNLVPGTHTFNIHYTQSQVVSIDDLGYPQLRLSLLSGFLYPTQHLSFSVTMPGSFTENPTFSSGYHQNSIESSITYTVSGATITGSVEEPLKDRETLVMTLRLPKEMFPARELLRGSNGSLCLTLLMVFAVLTVLFYLLTMAQKPLVRTRRTMPPENTSAGMLGNLLTHRDADLTMMVLSWAQQGYLRITMDRRGRVLLHRQMDMGNERNAFENRTFSQLFLKRNICDASSGSYARLAVQTAAASHRSRKKPDAGRVLRLLAAMSGAFAGAAMGDNLSDVSVLRILLMILCGGVSFLLCLQIQLGLMDLHLRQRANLYLGLACGVSMLVAGTLTGQLVGVAVALAVQLFAGLAVAYGGRRSASQRLAAQEILGLRAYLRGLNSQTLWPILQQNPDYFYTMLPYAMALGLGKRLSRRCGKLPLPQCTWFSTVEERYRNVSQFCALLQEAVLNMDARIPQFPWERLK